MPRPGRRAPRVLSPAPVNLALLLLALLLAAPSALRVGQELIRAHEPIDFAVYYLGAAILNSDRPALYAEDLLPAMASLKGVQQFTAPYIYPPVFAAALRPLAHLPYATAKGCWLVLNGVFLALSAPLLVRLAGFPARAPSLAAGALLVALYPPVHQALRLGQVSPLLLLLCAGSLDALLTTGGRPGHAQEAAAGLSVAIAAMAKVFPGLLIPYLLTTGRKRAFVYALAGLLACVALGIAWGGGAHNTLDYLGRVLPSLYRQRLETIQPDNQSLSAQFMRLFTPATYTIAMRGPQDWRAVSFTPLVNSRALAMVATYLSTIALLIGSAAAALWARGEPSPGDRWAAGFAMLLIVSLLAISSTYYHLLVLLLVPLATLVRVSRRLGLRYGPTLALGAYLLLAIQRYANWLVVWTSSAWLAAFGLYAALLLWGSLFYCSRKMAAVVEPGRAQ